MRVMLGRLLNWWRMLLRVRAAYRLHHGRAPALWWPRRYSEKLQCRKLFSRDPRYVVLCDKLAVRDFIAARLPGAALAPLLWRGDDPALIPFATLRPPYVLKSSHGCGHIAFVREGETADPAALIGMAAAWLRQCHGTAADEPGYVAVPRRLLVERQLFGASGGPPLERRFFVFDGRVAVVNTVFVEAGRIRNGAFHRPDWTRLPWYLTRDLADVAFPRPPLLGPMLAAAARVAAGFDHLRVDIYDGGDRFWMGEVTVYPWSGHAALHPEGADFELGAAWRLRRLAAWRFKPAWRTRPAL